MAATPLAVVASDLHLEEQSYTGRSVRGDAYHAWDQVVEATLALDVDWLILAGDVLNRRLNPGSPLRRLHAGLHRLRLARKRVGFIMGQHDLDPDPVVGLSPNAAHLHRRTLDVGGLAVYGVDYQPAGKLGPELDAIPPGTDFAVFHQVWAEFMGSVAHPQGSFEDVPVVSAALTGDYHRRETWEGRGRDGQRLTVYSLGSTCMQEVSEPADKYYGVLHDDLTVRTRPLRGRAKIEPDPVTTPAELEALLARLPALLDEAHAAAGGLPPELRTPLLRVEYSHRLADASRRLRRAVGQRAHLFEKETPPSRDDPGRARAKAAGRALTLMGCLPLAVDKGRDPELFALAERVLGADDPKAEVAAWVREQTGG